MGIKTKIKGTQLSIKLLHNKGITNNVTHKGLVTQQLTQLTNNNKNNQKGRKPTFSHRRYTDGQQPHKNMLITNNC